MVARKGLSMGIVGSARGMEAARGSGGKAVWAWRPLPRSGGEGKVREEAGGARMGRRSLCWWASRMEATEERLGCRGKHPGPEGRRGFLRNGRKAGRGES